MDWTKLRTCEFGYEYQLTLADNFLRFLSYQGFVWEFAGKLPYYQHPGTKRLDGRL